MKTKQLLVLIAAAGLLAACTGKKTEEKKVAPKEDIPMVKVESVYQENVSDSSEYTATVEPFKINSISSNSGARIKNILVDVGSHVSAGQKVVVLDDVNIATMDASIDQMRIQLANTKRDLERAKELVRIGGGTQQAADQLQAAYDAQLKAIESSTRQKTTMNENTVLTAPISGVVTTKNYNNGDLPAGLPVLVIEQQNPLKVIVNVNETEFSLVKQGMSVSVTFDAYPGEKFAGKVHIIHPQVDPNSRTFKVEVTIVNTNNKVRTGMFARVKFNFGSRMSVVVPDQAVQKQVGSGVRFVYVYSNGVVQFRTIELGRRLENRYEVISGLESGAQVVTYGHSRLNDGCKVQLAQ
ncbi:MAG: efflux RND transporter periplasmic adaptor subunit [Muribaculaceae bacterium]|nr:efflux RND transporter periplasmic adaptor subunit [Muribaculaceae bacterium]